MLGAGEPCYLTATMPFAGKSGVGTRSTAYGMRFARIQSSVSALRLLITFRTKLDERIDRHVIAITSLTASEYAISGVITMPSNRIFNE